MANDWVSDMLEIEQDIEAALRTLKDLMFAWNCVGRKRTRLMSYGSELKLLALGYAGLSASINQASISPMILKIVGGTDENQRSVSE